VKLLFVWCGPVSSFDLKGITWPAGTSIAVYGHGPSGGISSADFGLAAAKYRGANGRILPNLVAKVGYDIANFDRIAVAGFSAAHGLLAQVLRDDADGKYVDAALSEDACFSSPTSISKPGYTQYSARAARGEKLFVHVGTAGDYQGVTGWQCALTNAAAGAKAAGMSLASVGVPSGVPAPKSALGVGDLVALDYSGVLSHKQVVPALTAPLVNAYLLPYLRGADFGGEPPASSSAKTVVVAGATLVALAGGLYAWKRWG